jgi:hypothetical protein
LDISEGWLDTLESKWNSKIVEKETREKWQEKEIGYTNIDF